MAINLRLPDLDGMMQDIATEFKARVERRTPRSKLSKDHLQDQWKMEKTGEGYRIVNAFEYAIFVEEGTSKMEGRHMVRTTREEIPEIVAEALENAKTKT